MKYLVFLEKVDRVLSTYSPCRLWFFGPGLQIVSQTESLPAL